MKVVKTELEGVLVIEPKVFGDDRGFFYETFHAERYKDAGIPLDFVQDNRSRSSRGVLRGLHFQKTRQQGKLVTVTKGSVFDVAVDLRPESATFGLHKSIVLSEDNKLQFYIPPGFAHGFYVMSDIADFQYKCTDFYHPEDEWGLLWNDKDINIAWPDSEPLLSKKDSVLPTFNVVKEFLAKGKD